MANDSTARDIASGTASVPGGGVRPKILRRPAQFSNSAAIVPLNIPPAMMTQTPLEMDTPVPVQRPWQDDGRFAVTLLALVILINVAVIVWLAAITQKPPIQPLNKPVISATDSAAIHELNSGNTGAEQ